MAAANRAAIYGRNNEMNARSTASSRPPPPAVTQQRKAEQTLRNEQDREYEETLLADQIRDIERREVEAKERRGHEEKEEAKLLETAKRASVLDGARSRMARAGDEPPLNADDVARLRFNLPNGKKVDRRFRASDTIETVRAFLVVHFHEQGIKTKNPKYPRLGLITNFPKREFGEEDGRLSLEEAGLAPQAVVMVQDLDA